jgi:hypothetical protein
MNGYSGNDKSIRPRASRPVLGLFVLCLVLSCCAVTKDPPPQAVPGLAWRQKTPKEILSRLRYDQNRIRSLSAAFSLSLEPPPEGRPSSLRGVLFFARGSHGPRVRIKGLGLFGRLLFDMVLKGDDIQIYIASQRTLYRGRADHLKKGGNVWKDTLTAMFADFSGASVSENAALTFRDDHVILPLKEGEILIDRKTAMVRQWRRKGEVITYDDFEHKPGLPSIPTRIDVQAHDASQRAFCKLRQVCVNCDTTDVFDLSGYKPRAVLHVRELEKASGHGF